MRSFSQKMMQQKKGMYPSPLEPLRFTAQFPNYTLRYAKCAYERYGRTNISFNPYSLPEEEKSDNSQWKCGQNQKDNAPNHLTTGYRITHLYFPYDMKKRRTALFFFLLGIILSA